MVQEVESLHIHVKYQCTRGILLRHAAIWQSDAHWQRCSASLCRLHRRPSDHVTTPPSLEIGERHIITVLFYVSQIKSNPAHCAAGLYCVFLDVKRGLAVTFSLQVDPVNPLELDQLRLKLPRDTPTFSYFPRGTGHRIIMWNIKNITAVKGKVVLLRTMKGSGALDEGAIKVINPL